MAEQPPTGVIVGQRVRALRPGSGLVVEHDDTRAGSLGVQLPPIEMASYYERAQAGELSRALPEVLPPSLSLCWPDRGVALVSRTVYRGGALGAEANLVTHDLAVRRSFFQRGFEALGLLAAGPRSPFIDEWDGSRAWDERRRIEHAASQVTADPDAALAQLGEIACDPTVSTFPDERLAACMRAVVNLARTGEPVVIEFADREFLLRGAFDLDLPLSILLLCCALVPPDRAELLSLRSWGWARTPELGPGRPAFSCFLVPESTGAPKRVLPGARLIRADGSTDRPFPDDGTGRLVTTAVATLRAAQNGSPSEAPAQLRMLRVLAAHAGEESPGQAAVWRAGRRSVPIAAVASAVRAAAAAGEPAEAVRLLDQRGFEPAAAPELRDALDALLGAVMRDPAPGPWLAQLLGGLQRAERYDLLGRLCDAAARRGALEGPILAWLCGQEDLSRSLELVGSSAAAEALRTAECGALPHGYRALASLLRLPGKPSPRLRALWSTGSDSEAERTGASDVRELLVSLALFGRAPRTWDLAAPAWAPLATWLRARMQELLAHDAAAARKERRPRGPSALMLAAQLDAAAACDGCAALLKSALSLGGKDADAWLLFLDRGAPEQEAWWQRALSSWRGALGDDLRAVLPEVLQRAGATPPSPAAFALHEDAQRITAALEQLGAKGHAAPLPPAELAHAVGVAWFQR